MGWSVPGGSSLRARGSVVAAAAIVACAVMALLPAAAGGRTLHEDLAAAHAYWGSDVCAGQWQVTPDTPEYRGVRGGAATGIGFTHNPAGGSYVDSNGRWDWHVARCEFTVNPELQGCARYWVVLHEVGHFIHGPGHDGAMSPQVLGRAPCPVPQAAAASTVSGGLDRRRTRAQIARSLRHKHARARIRARAVSCASRRCTSRDRHSCSACRSRRQSVQPASGGRGA